MKLAACQKYNPATSPSDWAVEPIKRRIWFEYGSGLTEENRIDGNFPVFGSNGQVGTHNSYAVDGPGILIGRKGSVGEVHYSESNFWPIDTVYYVRRLKQDDWHFLYYLLGFINLGLLNAATGVPGLTRRDAHDILGAFPSPDEQRRIAGILKLADDAKALDIEAMLTSELRIRLDQDEAFQPLSEKLQRIIDEKRAGTLAGIALIEEFEALTEAVRASVEESKRPIGQQLARKIKSRNEALTEVLAADVAAAILEEADKLCFPGWWKNSAIDPELSRALLLLIAQKYSAYGLLADDAMSFIGVLVQILKRKHYKPGGKE